MNCTQVSVRDSPALLPSYSPLPLLSHILEELGASGSFDLSGHLATNRNDLSLSFL